MPEELYISVDVETAGPIPGEFALLSIGACLVEDTSRAFYVELKPDRARIQPESMAVHGLSLEKLEESGISPKEAMQAFAEWVRQVAGEGHKPVFVALNAPFDWSFVNDYFHRYLGSNPFGHSALDIKAYYMGQNGVAWAETSLKHMAEHFLIEKHLTHNAMSDAQDQADIFRQLLNGQPSFPTGF